MSAIFFCPNEKLGSMSEFFERNAEVIQRRWPLLSVCLLFEDASLLQADLVEGLGSTLSINGIELASRHDRTREARLQADRTGWRWRTTWNTNWSSCCAAVCQFKKFRFCRCRRALANSSPAFP